MSPAPSDLDAHLGARLKQLRALKGLTQQDLAAAIGVTYQQLQKYEAGRNRISAAMLYAIAQALDAPVGYFFEGLPQSPPGPMLRLEVKAFLDYGAGVVAAVASAP